MSGEALRKVRKERGWTQAEAGARLGVSQAYVALLEKGHRRVPPELARKAVREFKLNPVLLPVSGAWHSAFSTQPKANATATATENSRSFASLRMTRQEGTSAVGPPQAERSVRAKTKHDTLGHARVNEMLARDLGRLGYPGFAYLRGGWRKNPGQVLLTALAQRNLDSRVAEALPWLLLHYPEVDADWLVSQARLMNLTNRLGFVVDLAKRVLERRSETSSPRYHAFTHLSEALGSGRLAVEDTFGRELTETERNWLRANRPPEAQFWNLLTNWQPEFLQYTE